MRSNGWRGLAVALVVVPLAVLAPPAGAAGHDPATYSVSSPDRGIAITFGLDDQGTPQYRVSHSGAPLLANSALGFQFADAPPAR